MILNVQAAFKPQLHLREAPLDPSKAALLYIDIQNYNCHPDGALYDGNAQVVSLTFPQAVVSLHASYVQADRPMLLANHCRTLHNRLFTLLGDLRKSFEQLAISMHRTQHMSIGGRGWKLQKCYGDAFWKPAELHKWK